MQTALPAQHADATDFDLLVLRDGFTAMLRLAETRDVEELKEFFRELPREKDSSVLDSFSAGDEAEVVRELCENSRSKDVATILATRTKAGRQHVLAVGCCRWKSHSQAEVAIDVATDRNGAE